MVVVHVFILGIIIFDNVKFSVIYSVTPDSGPSQLSIVIDTTTTTTASRRWNMRIYQYECTSPVLGMYVLLKFFKEEILISIAKIPIPKKNVFIQLQMGASNIIWLQVGKFIV